MDISSLFTPEVLSVVAQAISIIAMATYIFSYCQKKSKTIIFFQFIATIFFSISFAMMGAVMGAMLNIISAIRAVLFLYKKQLKTDNNIWLVAFFSVYALVFTVFGKEFTLTNAIIQILPIIGMVASTFGFRAKSATGVRIGGLINEPVWLIYNIVEFSIGAIIANSFSIFSIFLGFMRDKKEKRKNLS